MNRVAATATPTAAIATVPGRRAATPTATPVTARATPRRTNSWPVPVVRSRPREMPTEDRSARVITTSPAVDSAHAPISRARPPSGMAGEATQEGSAARRVERSETAVPLPPAMGAGVDPWPANTNRHATAPPRSTRSPQSNAHRPATAAGEGGGVFGTDWIPEGTAAPAGDTPTP